MVRKRKILIIFLLTGSLITAMDKRKNQEQSDSESSIVLATQPVIKKIKPSETELSARGVSKLRSYELIDQYVSVAVLQHIILEYLDSFDVAQTLSDCETASSLKVSPDGSYFATGPEKSIRLWHYSPTGCRVINTSQNRDLDYFSFFDYRDRYRIFDPYDNYLAIAHLQIKKVVNNGLVPNFEEGAFSSAVKHLEDPRDIGLIHEYYYSYLKQIITCTSGGERIACTFFDTARFAELGVHLAIGAVRFGGVNIWKKTRLGYVSEENLPMRTGGEVNALAFSPDGTFLVVGAVGPDMTIWKLNKKDKYQQFQEISPDGGLIYRSGGMCMGINCVTFAPRKDIFASASEDKIVRIWQLIDDTFTCTDTLEGHTLGVTAVQFINDDLLVSASEDKTLRIWKLEAGKWKFVHVLTNHSASVKSVAYSPNGKYLASASGDKQIKIWLNTALLLREYHPGC